MPRSHSILPPQKQPHMTESVLLGKREVPGIPPNPLPTWVTLPMEAKLPMLPGPKGAVVLYTTSLGEKIHKSSRDLGFDLTDPYAMLLSNHYKPLHDPHLKPHLTGPGMKKRLYRSGFISKDGKVLCTLREFNEYRQYLRKISLRQENEKKEADGGLWRQKRKTFKDTYGSKMARMKEEKVREIKKRLEKQHEEDRNRYARLLNEVEERRNRLREEQMARISRNENNYRQQQDKRHADIRRRYHEDRVRKMEQLQMWFEEDRNRTRRAEQRRKIRELERQKKLEESWEVRKRVQRSRLEQEAKMRKEQEDLNKKGIEQREKLLTKQRERQQRILLRMTDQRRTEKERMAAAYSSKFDEKMRKRRAKATKKKRKKPKPQPRQRSPFKSVWDLEKSLLDTFPPHAEHMPSIKAHRTSDYALLEIIEEHLREQEQQRELHTNLSQLGLADFRGALFSPEVVRKASQELSTPSVEELQQRVSQLGLEDFRGATFSPAIIADLEDESESQAMELQTVQLEDPMVCYRYERPTNIESDMKDVAKYIVDVTVELATKVVYPAYMQYLEEDKPALYSQYNRPITPQPSDMFELTSGEEEDAVAAYKSRGVRFSTDEENIPLPLDAELTYWDEDWIEVPEEEEEEGYQDDDEEDYSEEDLRKKSSLLAKVAGRDSITKMHTSMSGTEQIQDLDALLGRIMGLLSCGSLDHSQMRQLAQFAKDIIDALDTKDLASPIKSPDIPPVSLSPVPGPGPHKSSTSELAEQVVDQTLQKIYDVLFEVPEPKVELNWDETPPMSASSVSALANVLTSEAISRATASLEELSARTPVRKTSSEEASNLVSDTLKRISQEIQPRPVPIQQPKSMTSMLVMETINKVADELRTEEETEIGRTASLIVQQTLEKVAAQVQETSRRSSTSLFVQEVLGKVADEIEERKDREMLRWDKHKPLKTREECGSLTSILIRDTLSKVVCEIEENSNARGRVTKSASSAFAEELVTDTLTKCLHDVKSGTMERSQIFGFVGAALNSAKTLTWKSQGISTTASTQSLGTLQKDNKFKSTNSLLVEALVRETLVSVQQDISGGTISQRELVELQNSIQFADVVKRTRLGTSESLEAESLVMKAIGNVLDDLGVESVKFDEEPMSEPSKKPSEKEVATTDSTPDIPPKKKSTLQKISDAVFGVFKRSSSSNTKPKSTESEVAESVVADVIADVGSNITTTIPEIKLTWNKENINESSGKPQSSTKEPQNTGYASEHSVIVLDEDESDTDSEPGMEIHPTVHGKEIHVDSHLVGDALNAFSSREVSALRDPCDPTAHYSYRDIFHPDIARVAVLHTDSEESLKHQFMNVSHRNIVLHSHLTEKELEKALQQEEEIDKGGCHQHEVQEALLDDLEGLEPVDSVLSVVEIHSGSGSNLSQNKRKSPSKTQSLGSSSNGKAVSSPTVTKTTSTGVVRRLSSTAERQRIQATSSQKATSRTTSSEQAATKISSTSSSKQQNKSANSSFPPSRGKKTPQGNSSRTSRASKKEPQSPAASPVGKPLEKRVTSRTDSNLILLKEVADRLDSKEDGKQKKTNTVDGTSKPNVANVGSSPNKVKSLLEKDTDSKIKSLTKSETSESKKGKPSKSSLPVTPERKSSKEDTSIDIGLRRTPSAEDTIKAYSSGSASPVKMSKKKSSKLSLKKGSSNESTEIQKHLESKAKSDKIINDTPTSVHSSAQLEDEALVAPLVKKSSSRNTLPSSLTQVTQIPQKFPPIDAETMSLHSSSRGSLGSNASSQRSMDKLQRLPPSEVPRRGSVPSMNRKFSVLIDKIGPERHQSHGHFSHPAKHEKIKSTQSAHKSSGHRYHSLRDEPESCQSFTSIPKHVDSLGNVHEDNELCPSGNSSVASAPTTVSKEAPLSHKGSKNLLHHLEHPKRSQGDLSPKHAESATKSSGHRHHSLRDEPDSCPSFTSIPKQVDSCGVMHLEDEDNPSGKSSIASAPERLEGTTTVNPRTPSRSITVMPVGEEGTPV